MKSKSPQQESAPPRMSVVQAATECVQNLVQEGKIQFGLTKQAVTSSAKAGYEASSTRVLSFVAGSRSYLLRAAAFFTVFLLLCAIIITDLSACLVTSVAAAAGLRRYALSSVPGTTVIPLHYNALPFHGQDWQHRLPGDAVLRDFLLPVRETQALIAAAKKGDASHTLERRLDQLTEMKFSLLNHFVSSHLASTTMPIPRGAAAADVFSPRGGVNLESLFQRGPAMFSAKGEYTARVQVVLAKEEVGRAVSLILESTMLFAEDDGSVAQVYQLDTLFKESTSTIVHTGPVSQTWMLSLLRQAVRLWFYPPVRAYEYWAKVLQQRNDAPFAPVDPDTEIAVVLDVYSRFTPPVTLQPRLRAMNFTLSQLPQLHAPAQVQVTRMTFFSTVQLTGVARWLADYPIISMLLLVSVLFGLSAAATLSGIAALMGYVYWQWLRSWIGSEAAVEDSSDSEFFSTPYTMPPTTAVRNVSFAGFRRMRSQESFHDALDTSQLRRSNSFSTSSYKKKQ